MSDNPNPNPNSSSNNTEPRRVPLVRSNGLPAANAPLLVNGAFLRTAVRKPGGVNINHWLSTHTVDFFQLTTVLYGSLVTVCTNESCACMNCGSTFEYLWRDPGQRPVRLSAPEYVDRLSQWIDQQLNDETKFPTTTSQNSEYPDDFLGHVKNIFRRLFRVYAHAYTSHYDSIERLNMHASFNTAFVHFMSFASEFDLISVLELRPARELLFSICEDIAAERFAGENAPPGGGASAEQ